MGWQLVLAIPISLLIQNRILSIVMPILWRKNNIAFQFHSCTLLFSKLIEPNQKNKYFRKNIMLFNVGKSIIFLSIVLVFSLSSNNSFEELNSKGFIEIANTIFLKEDYRRVYDSFSKFIDAMTLDTEFSQKIRASEKEFLQLTEQKIRYCSAPPSYRNPKQDPTKRHNKIYFQYINEYWQLIKEKYQFEIESKPEVLKFFDGMQQIDTMSKKMYSIILDEFEKNSPGIKKLFYGNHGELTVITKIVRYEKAEPDRWGTTAHYDKSGFTLIWDSNDDNDDSLLICDDLINPSLDKLIKPVRTFSGKEEVSSTILIVGSALSKLGINIKPTLHGVAPIKKHHRFAIISFLLIPDIDMSDIKTDFEPKL